MLDEFNRDYEGTTTRKPNSDRSNKKRTPESVAEIQALIDDDPNKTI